MVLQGYKFRVVGFLIANVLLLDPQVFSNEAYASITFHPPKRNTDQMEIQSRVAYDVVEKIWVFWHASTEH